MSPRTHLVAARAATCLGRGAGILLVGLAAGACGGAEQDGRLAVGTTPGTLCMVAADGQTVTWGWDVVTNEGDDPVTLVAVGLADAVSLEVREAWVVPAERTLIGNQGTFPPPPGVSPQWAARREAAGAVLAPGETANLVLAVRPLNGDDGSAAGTRIRYADESGREFTETAATALQVLQSRSRC